MNSCSCHLERSASADLFDAVHLVERNEPNGGRALGHNFEEGLAFNLVQFHLLNVSAANDDGTSGNFLPCVGYFWQVKVEDGSLSSA